MWASVLVMNGIKYGDQTGYQLHFFYKNKVYKNIRLRFRKKLRIFQEYPEAEIEEFCRITVEFDYIVAEIRIF